MAWLAERYRHRIVAPVTRVRFPHLALQETGGRNGTFLKYVIDVVRLVGG